MEGAFAELSDGRMLCMSCAQVRAACLHPCVCVRVFVCSACWGAGAGIALHPPSFFFGLQAQSMPYLDVSLHSEQRKAAFEGRSASLAPRREPTFLIRT